MGEKQSIKIWDLATRTFHWLLVIAFFSAGVTGKNDIMWLHYYSAYSIMTLVIFRIIWGIIGSTTSRFSSFMPTPTKIRRYLKTLLDKNTQPSLGHNPLGALSIFAILGLLIIQITLGLFSQDSDFINAGPLVDLISVTTALNALDWHETVFHILLIIVGLHVCAILFYRLYKGQNLVKPMITGEQEIETPAKVEVKFIHPIYALFALGVSGATTWGIVSLLPRLLGLS